MTKLLSILLAGFFATSAFAQAETTKPGQTMGPTTNTEAARGGGSADKARIKGADGKTAKSAETVNAGGAQGPTKRTEASKGGGSTHHKGPVKGADGKTVKSAETVHPGDAMGPTNATNAAKGGQK